MSRFDSARGLAVAALAVACHVGTAHADVVTVARSGSGGGTITSNVGGIACGATCAADVAASTSITLTATPAPDSQFTGWLGRCTGTDACTFSVDGPTAVTATFAPAAIGAPTLDIDGTGAYEPSTDGLLIIRYLLGLTGEELILAAVGDGTRTTASEIESYLNDIRPILDVDGNGQADALTDGVVIIRYLLGLRGASLVSGATGHGASRLTANDLDNWFAQWSPLPPPPEPSGVAPPVDPGIPTNVYDATKFLYTAVPRVQNGVAAGVIRPQRAALIRGKVHARDGSMLAGVTISIDGHPEFGSTQTRDNGMFDMVVNGGGRVTANYQKSGYLPVSRQLDVPWQDYANAADVTMLAVDTQMTLVTLNAGAMQVAESSTSTDSAGTRRNTLLVPSGTTAHLVMPDGSTQAVGMLSVRATEYTVGTNGPATMPAALPPTSGYTYAVELSADEAIASGAAGVSFNQPLFNYVQNFLGFPVGSIVPAGYYDRQRGAWIPSDNGRVVKITAINGGTAEVDTVGGGSLPALVLGTAERQHLATLYSVGQELWRVPISHFSPWDYNWPYGPPNDAIAPDADVRPPQPLDRPNCEEGSIVECENQILGETIRLVGAPYSLNYRSDRVPGRTAGRNLSIRLSGASIPASLSSIKLNLQIAGQVHSFTFPAAANQQATFAWDGKDAYGRTLQGVQTAIGSIDYVYPAVYKSPADFAQSFGNFGSSSIVGSAQRSTVTISKPIVETLGFFDARGTGLGGWTLSAHHFYDPVGRVLYTGDGRRRSARSKIVETVVDEVYGAHRVVAAPDGSIYVGLQDRVQKIALDGQVTTIAGGGDSTADGIPATQATLNIGVGAGYGSQGGLALGPDGNLYVGDRSANGARLRKITTAGIISTVAGVVGERGFSGDGGPAIDARLAGITDAVVAPDGSIYIADFENFRTRRITPDGIINTVAGNGNFAYGEGEGVLAIEAGCGPPRSIALAPDGTLYIGVANAGNPIFRVSPEGRLYSASGGFDQVGGLAVGPDGFLYASGSDFSRQIFLLRADKTALRVFGTGGGFGGDGGPALQAAGGPQGLSFAPNGTLLFADDNGRVRRIGAAMPGFTDAAFVIASEDGSEIYGFDASGTHLRTINALTGTTLLDFGYDAAKRLVTITQRTGTTDNVTTIQRDGAGHPTAVVGPHGQVTGLTLDGNGYLASVGNPAGESIVLTYSAGGLLQTYKNPRNKITSFSYDSEGRLSVDADSAGGSQALARVALAGGTTVTRTTALGRVTTYETQDNADNRLRTLTRSDGTQSVTADNFEAATTTVTAADGTVTTVSLSADERFAMQSPVASSTSIGVPDGPTFTVERSRTAVLANPLDPLSISSLTEISTVAGTSSSATYTALSKTGISTSAAGRTATLTIDAFGRVVNNQLGNLEAFVFAYDGRGRLASVTQGTGVNARSHVYGYGADGSLATITDPLGRITQLARDAAGRIVNKILPGGDTVSYAYDTAGNLTALTPPGRPAHAFAYSDRDELTAMTPPAVAGTGPSTFLLNADRQLVKTAGPDDRSISIDYDAGGRVVKRSFATGVTTTAIDTFSYDAAGRLSAVTGTSGVVSTHTYAGALLTGITTTGPAPGSVAVTYDAAFRLAGESVNGAALQAHAYDDDGLLTGVGAMTLTRHAQHGLPTASSLGVVTTTFSYNGFAELASQAASASGTALHSVSYVRDKLGRVTQKTETIGGVSDIYAYTYNVAGRLVTVAKNGTPIEAYAYDANGNRTSATVNGVTRVAAHDNQDRLVSAGAATYVHSAAGDLTSRTESGQTTSYQYDAAGNLLTVILPNGTNIGYVVDGRNRRVGKRINGTLVRGFLYGTSRQPLAELDGAGVLQARFVYALGLAPAFMIKAGVTYRVVTDHLGSVRLVINTTTGAIAQRIDYDGFGNVTLDSSPGFQPFGFAGGLYDADTGLVRFGRRDYAAFIGRWTTKDPMGFRGRDTNLYAYVRSDPVNRTDPKGTAPDGGNCWYMQIDGPPTLVCDDDGTHGSEQSIDPSPPPPPQTCSPESRPKGNAVTGALYSDLDTGQSCAEGFGAVRTGEKFRTECVEAGEARIVVPKPDAYFPKAWAALRELMGGYQPAPFHGDVGGPRG